MIQQHTKTTHVGQIMQTPLKYDHVCDNLLRACPTILSIIGVHVIQNLKNFIVYVIIVYLIDNVFKY